MKTLLVTLFFLVTSLFSVAEEQLSTFTNFSDSFFKKYVSNGSVDYGKIKQNIGEVEALYALIGGMNLSSVDVAIRKCFYENAYNVIVIYWVAKHYSLKSPLDNSSFFDKVKYKVAGEEITLNSPEIKKLLLPYKDARLHFALGYAAKSCPPLASFAHTPVALDKQLTERATAVLNNPGWLKTNNAEKKVELSKIFEWYIKDFTTNGKTELEWINQYRKEKIPATYAVGFYEYNWALNEK
jgi:hypothetical protein